MITKSGATQVYWTGEVWHVVISHAIDHAMMKNIIEFTRPIQVQRWRSLPPGDLKEDCARSIKALDDKKLVQVFVGPGEKVLHDSYARNRL